MIWSLEKVRASKTCLCKCDHCGQWANHFDSQEKSWSGPSTCSKFRGNFQTFTIQDYQRLILSNLIACKERFYLMFWTWSKYLTFRIWSSQSIKWEKYSKCAGIHQRQQHYGGWQSQARSCSVGFDTSKSRASSCVPLGYFTGFKGTKFFPLLLTPYEKCPKAFAEFHTCHT